MLAFSQHVLSVSSEQPQCRPALFVASDEPALKKLDLYKKWGRNADGDTARIA
jgi:hypothetical protein